MSLSVNLNLVQKQKLVVTQTLREAIQLLQYSSLELMNKIEHELEENPVLEVAQSSDDSVISGEEMLQQSGDDAPLDSERTVDQETLDRFADSSDLGYLGSEAGSYSSDPDSKQQFLEGAVKEPRTFQDILLDQLRWQTWNEEDYAVGEVLISCLDEQGYFKEDVRQVALDAAVAGRDSSDFERILELIRTFDPPGVAAADLRQCLLLQLKEKEDPLVNLARRIILNHFDLLEKHQYKRISELTGVSRERVDHALRLIESLEPNPARPWSTSQTEYVIPDVIVEVVDGEFSVTINDDWLPNLGVSSYYADLLQKPELNKEIRNYIKEKYSSAQWLIRSIAQRRTTIIAVVASLLKFQEEFFLHGPEFLRPLTLKDVAEKIEMHESTVSRVTSNKYIQTPWGLYNMKYFFSSSIRTESGGVESSQVVKEQIRRIIDSESREQDGKVYSDQDIVDILNNKGIKIARRTVAKYRKMLKILPANRRHK